MTSRWFVPGPQSVPTVEEQFAMDEAVASTARVMRHRPLSTSTFKMFGADLADYEADMQRQRTHDRISALRNGRK